MSLNVAYDCLRRIVAPAPSKPAANSSNVAGSGASFNLMKIFNELVVFSAVHTVQVGPQNGKSVAEFTKLPSANSRKNVEPPSQNEIAAKVVTENLNKSSQMLPFGLPFG